MEKNVFDALVAEAQATGKVEDNWAAYEEQFMADVYTAVEERTGTFLEPSTQLGRGCVDGYGGEYDGATYDYETETEAMVGVLAQGGTYEEAVERAYSTILGLMGDEE